MNYSKNYYSYIDYVKTLRRSKKDGVYYEKHHIQPRCCGGANDPANLVLLTAREHFLAHYLLTKIFPTESKLLCAFILMCGTNSNMKNRTYINSRLYAACRLAYAADIREKLSGKPFSQEHKKKLSEAKKGKPWTEAMRTSIPPALKANPSMKGKHHSEETRRKLSEKNKNHKSSISEEGRERISRVWKGKHRAPFSEEHKKHISESHRGIRLSKDTIEKIVIKTRKKVRCVETNEVFLSLKAAAKSKNTYGPGITLVCQGKQKTAGGFCWEYARDE